MTNLNLLPPQEQKEISYLISWQALKIITTLICTYFIIILIIFVGANILTKKYTDSITSPDELEKKLNQKSSTSSYNQELQTLLDIQNDSFISSQVLISLSNAIPANIFITGVGIDYKKNTLKIEGVAPNREASLELIKNMENLSWLQNINTPLTNLLTKNNIKFTINATLDPAKLPKL